MLDSFAPRNVKKRGSAGKSAAFLVVALIAALASGGCAAGRGARAGGRTPMQRAFDQAFAKASQQMTRDLGRIGNFVVGLTTQVQKQWGQREAKVADRTVFVKYTQNYVTRAIADFDHGTVTIETMDDSDPQGSLRRAIVTTLLTSSDPRSVDLFSADSVVLEPGREPYLGGLVLDAQGRAIKTAEQAERFAAHLVQTRARSHGVQVEAGNKTVHVVKFAMVANFSQRNAARYRTAVLKYAQQYRVSPSLIFAIMRTESNFNPFAVSSVPAFGLMQLVPRTGGRDAYRRAKGVDEAPSSEYLFNPDNNIELGTAYLSVLASGYLGRITNPVSREYCVIAAYNTGAGNVFKAFGTSKPSAFADEVNRLDPAAVYQRLRTSLPYAETRNYLAKVVDYRKGFLAMTGDAPVGPHLAALR
jgi:membrane-bound lytic murein transglycosylase C